MIFVTLFDSGYLDKGLVLFDSLVENVKDFKLYVVAFDSKCFEVLSKISEDRRLIPIALEDFEDARLLEAKENRSHREYCWTCSSYSILYVLKHYNERECTYIDADMLFYSSVTPIIEQLRKENADVGIMRHDFPKSRERLRFLKNSGEFCVEFNYFKNTENGLRILEWWCRRCLENCSESMDGVDFGDQKYIEQFPQLFSGVTVVDVVGAGVAPWNVSKFRPISINKGRIALYDRERKDYGDLIFYHFQQIRNVSEDLLDINVNMYPGRVSKMLINSLYSDYLSKIASKRRFLKKHFSVSLEKGDYQKKLLLREHLFFLLRNERDIVICFCSAFRYVFWKKNDYFGTVSDDR